jgi:hypothetical protein
MPMRPQASPLHAFFVHSNITLLSAIGIIQEFKLRAEDVCMVFLRGYALDVPYTSYDFPYIPDAKWRSDFFGRSRAHIRGARQRLSEFDGVVARITDQRPTHYYFPHTGRDVYHLLITHPATLSFSLLDEGTSSYSPRKSAYATGRFGTGADSLKGIARIFARRAFFACLYGRRAMGRGEFHHSAMSFGRGARHYFGFGDTAHPGAPRRHKLDLRAACDTAADIFVTPVLPKDTRLFALPSLFHRDGKHQKRTLDGVKTQVARAAADGVPCLAYKAHPSMQASADPTVDAVLEAAARFPGLHTRALEQNVCLEALIALTPGMSVIGEGSSVGFYARMLGAEVIGDPLSAG